MKSGVTAGDFWLWAMLGGFIIVGPFIFMHKFLHAVNVGGIISTIEFVCTMSV